MTALHHAAVAGNPEIVQLLIEHGGNVNQVLNITFKLPHPIYACVFSIALNLEALALVPKINFTSKIQCNA